MTGIETYETFPKCNSTDNSAAFSYARELAEEFTAGATERQKVNTSFSQMVKQILEVKKIGVTEFQERTLLSKVACYLF